MRPNARGSARRTKRMAMKVFAALAATLAVGSDAHAWQTFDFYSGVRQAGMGGAYVGVVNDEGAILQNPAALGKIRDVTFNLLNPQVQGSFTATDSFNINNYASALDPQSILDALNKVKGTPYSVRGNVFPSIIMPNFGAGVYGNVRYDALVDSAGTNFQLDYARDIAGAIGYSLRFFGGVFKLGFNGRVVDRTEISQTLAANSTGLTLDSLKRSGMGLGSDIGMILTIPTAWLPSIAAVAHDVGGTSFGLGSGMFGATTYRPADVKTKVDVALSLFPIVSKRSRLTLTVEARDVVTIGEESDALKRFRLGTELNVADFFFLRAGVHQRYWTAGIEFATPYFQLQGASYGEEVGTSSATIEDRRWVGSFAIRF